MMCRSQGLHGHTHIRASSFHYLPPTLPPTTATSFTRALKKAGCVGEDGRETRREGEGRGGEGEGEGGRERGEEREGGGGEGGRFRFRWFK